MNFATVSTRKLFLRSLLVLSLTLLVGHTFAHSAWGDYPELVVTVSEAGVTLENDIAAGFYRLVVIDQTDLEAEVFFARIGDTSSEHEVHHALHGISAVGEDHGAMGPALKNLRLVADLVGGRMTPESVIIELRQGMYTVVTSLDDMNGQPITSGLTVRANANALPAPVADVRVVMTDFSFALPANLAAGPQTWELANGGHQIHHLILLRYGEGATFEDVQAFMSAEGPPSGPPPFIPVVASELLTSSVSNYFQFDLEPGNYLAICFLPDEETGAPHFALGMMQEFSVPGN